MSRPGAAPDRGWRNSAVHREVDHRHARWVFKVVLGVAIALAPLVVYLLETMSYVETSYALEDVRGREAHTIESEHRLIIEKAVLESLPAVESRAAAQLGLERAPAAHIVVVSPDDLSRPAPSGDPRSRPRPR
jgi:hypothetical protein